MMGKQPVLYKSITSMKLANFTLHAGVPQSYHTLLYSMLFILLRLPSACLHIPSITHALHM